MIGDALVTIWYYFIQVFLFIFSTIFSLLDTLIPYDVSSTFGIVFGNIFLLDSFLPVTEAFYMASLALSFKLAIFGYKAVWAVVYFTRYVRTFIIGGSY